MYQGNIIKQINTEMSPSPLSFNMCQLKAAG